MLEVLECNVIVSAPEGDAHPPGDLPRVLDVSFVALLGPLWIQVGEVCMEIVAVIPDAEVLDLFILAADSAPLIGGL